MTKPHFWTLFAAVAVGVATTVAGIASEFAESERVRRFGDVLLAPASVIQIGLHDFFAAIGKPRIAGEPAPAPFARPANTLEVEKASGFGPKIGD